MRKSDKRLYHLLLAGCVLGALSLTAHADKGIIIIKRDVQANPNFIGRPMLGSHLEAHLIDTMRRLVREGKWKANTNGQPLWNGPEGLFLVIQSGWKDLYAGLMAGGFSGIPLTSPSSPIFCSRPA